MRTVVGFLLMPLIGLIATSVAAETTQENCATRLDRTLVAMRERPLLKEEHATALMWLRMDAAEADAAGDEAGCIANIAVVETLLGIALSDEN